MISCEITVSQEAEVDQHFLDSLRDHILEYWQRESDGEIHSPILEVTMEEK